MRPRGGTGTRGDGAAAASGGATAPRPRGRGTSSRDCQGCARCPAARRRRTSVARRGRDLGAPKPHQVGPPLAAPHPPLVARRVDGIGDHAMHPRGACRRAAPGSLLERRQFVELGSPVRDEGVRLEEGRVPIARDGHPGGIRRRPRERVRPGTQGMGTAGQLRDGPRGSAPRHVPPRPHRPRPRAGGGPPRSGRRRPPRGGGRDRPRTGRGPPARRGWAPPGPGRRLRGCTDGTPPRRQGAGAGSGPGSAGLPSGMGGGSGVTSAGRTSTSRW